MTIQEAIKSGKRFKRKDWMNWTHKADLELGFKIQAVKCDDLLAEDWEVEEVDGLNQDIALDEYIDALAEFIKKEFKESLK